MWHPAIPTQAHRGCSSLIGGAAVSAAPTELHHRSPHLSILSIKAIFYCCKSSYFVLQKLIFCFVKALLYSPDGERNLIRRRTQSNRAADAIQSGGERNPIGQRSVYNDKNIGFTLLISTITPLSHHDIITQLTVQNIIFYKKSANNLADSKIMRTFALAKLTQLVP